MSNHFLEEARLKVFFEWRSAGRMEGVLEVGELNTSVNERACQESMREKYEVLRGGDAESVKTKWEMFKYSEGVYYNDVCGERRMGEQRRTRSVRWSEEVGVVVGHKFVAQHCTESCSEHRKLL